MKERRREREGELKVKSRKPNEKDKDRDYRSVTIETKQNITEIPFINYQIVNKALFCCLSYSKNNSEYLFCYKSEEFSLILNFAILLIWFVYCDRCSCLVRLG